MSLPASVERIAPRIDQRLGQLFDEELPRWSDVDADLTKPLEVLRSYVLSGGKRLRPAFCYWAFVGAGGDPDDPAVVDAGAALEMLHTSALVHDDVIDGSARRHGADTVHVQFADLHRRSRWTGPAERFGEAVAIVVGDLAMVYSSRLLAGAPSAALSVFEEMRLEVNVGQYLDVLGGAQGLDLPAPAAVERARRICRYKTAKYTIERPLHLGAALAAPETLPQLAGPLSKFGLPLGEAFQLRDDLLGVFGDPLLTGKPVGDDLREGKPTLLAGLAVQAGPETGSERFRSHFGAAAGVTDENLNQMQRFIEATGAKAQVESTIRDLVDAAGSALASLPLRPEALGALADLAAFVDGRNH